MPAGRQAGRHSELLTERKKRKTCLLPK